jgi:DNA-binding transcriptional ArsR family regulator
VQTATAIADPARRRILESLRSGPASAGEIAAWFCISRPAVSRHLRVLRECGLVHDSLVGRRRMYTLDPAPLAEITDWIRQFGAPAGWDQRFDALQTEVARARIDRRRSQQQPPGQPAAPPVTSTQESA